MRLTRSGDLPSRSSALACGNHSTKFRIRAMEPIANIINQLNQKGQAFENRCMVGGIRDTKVLLKTKYEVMK